MIKTKLIMLSILACFSLLPTKIQAQSKKSKNECNKNLPPLIDREIFFGDPEISNSKISPDGKYISFSKPYNDVRNIYVKKIDEAFEDARPVTADKRPVPGYFWSRDSKYILYVQDKDGNENYHVYAVDPSAPEEDSTGVPSALNLTPLEGVRAYIYAVPKNRPNEIIVGLNDRDPQYHDVYKVNIATGERELLITNTQGVAGYEFDLEGNVRLAIRQTEDGGTEILRVDKDTMARIYYTTFEESAYPYRFHKDGKAFYMVTNKGDDVDLTRLVLFNPVTLEEEFVESDPEKEVDFGGAIFSNDTEELLGTVYVGDKQRIYPIDYKLKEDIEFLKEHLPEGEINLKGGTTDMRYHLVAVSRDVDPGSVYLYDRLEKTVEFLYKSRPALNTEYLAPMKPIRYASKDGLEIPGYITIPKGCKAKNLPLVVFPHGGPWARDYWGYDAYTQFLANRGYAVFQPNFRASTGYGKKFLNAGNKEWGTGYMQHDITWGVKYLIDKGIVDPEKVSIFGGSYGGYATLAGLAFTPQLYKAGISYVGPSNLLTLLNSIPPYWVPMIKVFDKRVGDPDDPEDKKRLIQQSPLFSADKIQADLMVIQGANDPRVKKPESDQIVVALREMGRNVVYILAEDEGHGFRGKENRLAISVAMENFLADELGGRYQEDMPEEIKIKLDELTVDINTVSLPDTTMAVFAETAPLPVCDKERIVPQKTNYSVDMTIQGMPISLITDRELIKAKYKGQEVWRNISRSETPMGNIIDTFYLDLATLQPVYRSTSQGPATINISYTTDSIYGIINAPMAEIPIRVDINAPLLGDDSALDIALSAMELEDDFEGVIRTFDPMTQKIRIMRLNVVGSEEITVGDTETDTYIVELTPLDEESGGGTYNISKNKPYCLVQSITKLPANAGGGTVTVLLNCVTGIK